jgi:hypothetical protein
MDLSTDLATDLCTLAFTLWCVRHGICSEEVNKKDILCLYIGLIKTVQ